MKNKILSITLIFALLFLPGCKRKKDIVEVDESIKTTATVTDEVDTIPNPLTLAKPTTEETANLELLEITEESTTINPLESLKKLDDVDPDTLHLVELAMEDDMPSLEERLAMLDEAPRYPGNRPTEFDAIDIKDKKLEGMYIMVELLNEIPLPLTAKQVFEIKKDGTYISYFINKDGREYDNYGKWTRDGKHFVLQSDIIEESFCKVTFFNEDEFLMTNLMNNTFIFKRATEQDLIDAKNYFQENDDYDFESDEVVNAADKFKTFDTVEYGVPSNELLDVTLQELFYDDVNQSIYYQEVLTDKAPYLIGQSKGILLIEFWAPWSENSLSKQEEYNKLFLEYRDFVKYIKVNVDTVSIAVLENAKVENIPMLALYRDGYLDFIWEGMTKYEEIDIRYVLDTFKENPYLWPNQPTE